MFGKIKNMLGKDDKQGVPAGTNLQQGTNLNVSPISPPSPQSGDSAVPDMLSQGGTPGVPPAFNNPMAAAPQPASPGGMGQSAPTGATKNQLIDELKPKEPTIGSVPTLGGQPPASQTASPGLAPIQPINQSVNAPAVPNPVSTAPQVKPSSLNTPGSNLGKSSPTIGASQPSPLSQPSTFKAPGVGATEPKPLSPTPPSPAKPLTPPSLDNSASSPSLGQTPSGDKPKDSGSTTGSLYQDLLKDDKSKSSVVPPLDKKPTTAPPSTLPTINNDLADIKNSTPKPNPLAGEKSSPKENAPEAPLKKDGPSKPVPPKVDEPVEAPKDFKSLTPPVSKPPKSANLSEPSSNGAGLPKAPSKTLSSDNSSFSRLFQIQEKKEYSEKLAIKHLPPEAQDKILEDVRKDAQSRIQVPASIIADGGAKNIDDLKNKIPNYDKRLKEELNKIIDNYIKVRDAIGGLEGNG